MVTIKETSKIEILLEGLDESDMGSLLRIYNDVNTVKKELDLKLLELQTKLVDELKRRKWDTYKDEESKISIVMMTKQKEKVNKKVLKMLVNEAQYSQIVTKTSDEQITVINAQDRERLKKYGKR